MPAAVGWAAVDVAHEPAQPLDGQGSHAIAPSAQCGPDQEVGLGVSAAPPALAQVGADLPGGGFVELAVDVGLDLRAQSKVTEVIHVLGTRGRLLVIPGARMEYRAGESGFRLRD